MIDIHSHILPGIDDGSRSLSMSLEMAKQAVENGITHMICTPHIHSGYFDNSLKTIKPVFHELQHALVKDKVPVMSIGSANVTSAFAMVMSLKVGLIEVAASVILT